MEGSNLKPKSEITNVAYGSVPIAIGGSNDRIDRVEKMMSTILRKMDEKTPSQSSNPLIKSSQPDIHSFCNKSGHVASKCFEMIPLWKNRTVNILINLFISSLFVLGYKKKFE